MPRTNKILTGVAGEYFVAAELSRRGIVASITLRNTRGIDIIASTEDGSQSVAIQVKTSSGRSPSWMLSKTAEEHRGENLFYVFCSLGLEGDLPTYHVVPSAVIADSVSRGHASWLGGAKRDGSPRKDSSMRRWSDLEGKYKDAWHLLRLG